MSSYNRSNEGETKEYSTNNNYNKNYSGSHSSRNSNNGHNNIDSSNNMLSSQRPDGSYRNEVRVRPGYIPDAERRSYVPPAARTVCTSLPKDGLEDLDNRVESWADEVAPIIASFSESEYSETGTKTELSLIEDKQEFVVEETSKDEMVSDTESVQSGSEPAVLVTKSFTEESGESAREPRKPSQLATAIDTALDSSNVTNDSPRPIGRFATQIANDERDGRNYRRYDNRDSYSYNYNRDNNGYNRDNSGYNRDNTNYSRDGSNNNRDSYGRDSYNRFNNNWNRSIINENPATNSSTVSSSAPITSSPSSEIRIETEFKIFLEQLTALRREMAIINAKLEYIKYFKGLDRMEITETERERLAQESVLISRLDAIFESIDALKIK